MTTAYIEEDLDLNLIGAYEVMIPHDIRRSPHEIGEHTHHTAHLPAHIVASLLGSHLAIPVEGGKLKLGAFQSIILVELNGPRKRTVLIDYQEKVTYGKKLKRTKR